LAGSLPAGVSYTRKEPDKNSSRLAAGHTGLGEERSSSMAQFSGRMVSEVVQVFWAAMARGEFVTTAAEEVGTYREMGERWLRAEGGIRPRRGRDLKGRCLTFAEREEIALARAGGESMRSIARRLGRSPSTVSRELARNTGRGGYRATTAHAFAYTRACRPKPSKLATNVELRRRVEEHLARRYSPEQIVGRLRRQFPDDPQMRVAPETIYRSLYLQSRGALRRDLTRCLRTGRAIRRPCRQPNKRKNRVPGMINITERPAEAEDRAVPGHWEGDLILGKGQLSAIGTLVERTTGYTMLVHLPDGHKAEHVRDALIKKIQTIPDILRASLTWDQGTEMHKWKEVSVAADIDIYFCDPHSPWQRATNENTNGLLRQYFPKGTDLSVHSAVDLDWVATELNDRPRKRLGFAKPIEEIGPLLLR
jgi:transposase, IS30 family